MINEEGIWIPCDIKFYERAKRLQGALCRIVLLNEDGSHHEDCLCDECDEYEIDF